VLRELPVRLAHNLEDGEAYRFAGWTRCTMDVEGDASRAINDKPT
jgi:hypothetical protein